MSSSYYDVVVLGGGLAPLTCAALCAKRGMRVLVLGQQCQEPSYRVGRFELPRQPFVFAGLHAPPARRALSELGIGQSFRRLARAPVPAFQVALPGHRFDFCADESRLELEIDREFPEVKRAVMDLRKRLDERARASDALFERDIAWPPESLLEKRELARLAAKLGLEQVGPAERLLSELPETHPFRIAVLAPARFAAHADAASLSELHLARLLSQRIGDAVSIDGGLAPLSTLLGDKVRAHSGQLRPQERATQIVVRRGTACAVRLFGSDEEIGCGTVVAGIDVAAVQRLLTDRTPFEQLFEKHGEPQPRFYRYTLNVVLDPRGVPEGMARHVLSLRNPERPLYGDNLLRVELSSLDAQHRLLCVDALLPARTVEERDGSLDDARERLLDALRELVPFVDRHLVLVDSPHDGHKPWARDEALDLSLDAQARRGPTTMPIVHGFAVATALTVCAMPVRTPLRRLLLCSDQVAPGLGVEGELVAASAAAHCVSRSERSRDWMRRRLWTKVEI